MLPDIAKWLSKILPTATWVCHDFTLIEQWWSYLLIAHEIVRVSTLIHYDRLLWETTIMALSQHVMIMRLHIHGGMCHALLIDMIGRWLRRNKACIHSYSTWVNHWCRSGVLCIVIVSHVVSSMPWPSTILVLNEWLIILIEQLSCARGLTMIVTIVLSSYRWWSSRVIIVKHDHTYRSSIATASQLTLVQ